MITFEPNRTDAATVVAAKVPHHPDNLYFPWQFMHHPANGWECVVLLDRDGNPVEANGAKVFEVLPSLRRFKLIPGTHGVHTGKVEGTGPDGSETMARRMREGWAFIPTNAIVAKGKQPGIRAFGRDVPGGYVITYDGARGAIYADAWSLPTLRPAPGPVPKVAWMADPIGFAEFRRELIKRGIIAPPDPIAVDNLIRVQEKRAGRRITDVHIPTVAVRVEAENVKLRALETIMDHVRAGLPPNSTPQAAAKTARKTPSAPAGAVDPKPTKIVPPSAPLAEDDSDADE